jgi:alkaline phosphatase
MSETMHRSDASDSRVDAAPFCGGGQSRRQFLRSSVLLATAATTGHCLAADPEASSAWATGLVTDLHHADKPAAGSRFYRRTLEKLDEAATVFGEQQIDCLVELGDFIDAAATEEEELQYLATVEKKFAALCPDRHYVLGNHCVHTLSKDQFLGGVGQPRSYYSFDRAGWHFVVLDACFRSDGTPYGRKNFKWTDTNISEDQVDWLRRDLEAGSTPAVVFVHQRLDVDNSYGIRNQAAVRDVLARSGRVRAVLQGHSHKNDLRGIDGIPYCTLVAMVEGDRAADNGYSVLRAFPDGSLRLDGFRKQQDRAWPQETP